MNIEHYNVEKLKKEIRDIMIKYLDIRDYRVFFFGSRVKNENSPRADIDLGIEGAEELKLQIKAKIEEDIDNLPTLYKFDFVDFKNVSEEFKTEAMKDVEYVC